MNDGEAVWLEAEAGVQSELDAEVRSDAFEVFMAEAARMRIQDRIGRARIVLRCGVWLDGDIAGDDVIVGHLCLRERSGRRLVVPVSSITTATGSRPGRREDGAERTVSSWLREAWAAGDRLQLLTRDGRWIAGRLAHVGADHVDLVGEPDAVTVPFTAVDAYHLI